MSNNPVVIIRADKCIGCEQCPGVCPVTAITMKDGIAIVDPDLCIGCGKCVPVCPADAISFPPGTAPQKTEEAAPAEAQPEAAPAEADSSRQVWVFVEQSDGHPASISWELLGVGRKLSNDIGGRLAAVVMGENVRPLVDEAYAYGADLVYLIDAPVFSRYRTDPYLQAMTALANKYHPEILLLGATTMGRDLAGAVATTLRTGLTADCTGLTIDPTSKLLEQTRPAYGGNIMATILCEKRRPQMSTVRPKVMPMPEKHPGRTGELIEEKLALTEGDIFTKVLEYQREAAGAIRIEDAEIIISGGRGLGNPAGFKLLQELADVVGGVVGGSRAAVDSGWISSALQVGQTGKTVRPKIYFAFGISGAIQHLVGMQDSDVIVAVNSDANAPIMKLATYAIVGDLYKVVPALLEEFRKQLPARPAQAETAA
jgi:electron transfer flavoprotein alpha subunit